MSDVPQARVLTSTRLIKEAYTAEERADLGMDLTQTLQKKATLLEEFKGVKAQYNKRISDFDADVLALMQKISKGTVDRDIPIRTVIDLTTGLVRVTREDNEELLEERPVKDHERQLVLEVARDTAIETLEKGVASLAANVEEPPAAPAVEGAPEPAPDILAQAETVASQAEPEPEADPDPNPPVDPEIPGDEPQEGAY